MEGMINLQSFEKLGSEVKERGGHRTHEEGHDSLCIENNVPKTGRETSFGWRVLRNWEGMVSRASVDELIWPRGRMAMF